MLEVKLGVKFRVRAMVRVKVSEPFVMNHYC